MTTPTKKTVAKKAAKKAAVATLLSRSKTKKKSALGAAISKTAKKPKPVPFTRSKKELQAVLKENVKPWGPYADKEPHVVQWAKENFTNEEFNQVYQGRIIPE